MSVPDNAKSDAHDGPICQCGTPGDPCMPALSREADVPDNATPAAPRDEAALTYCDRCDGCGWMEGDVPLGVACKRCDGTGIEPVAPPREPHISSWDGLP